MQVKRLTLSRRGILSFALAEQGLFLKRTAPSPGSWVRARFGCHHLFPKPRMRGALLSALVFCVLLSTQGVHSVNAQEAKPAAGLHPNLAPVVLTQVPRNVGGGVDISGSASATFREFVPPAGRLVLIGHGANPVILTRDFESAADPEVSFDGKRILFAGKRGGEKFWQIYEMAFDGTPPRRITKIEADCRLPCYFPSLFTLDAETSWFQVGFVSNLAREWTEAGLGSSWEIFSCKLDGTEVWRLTFTLGQCSEMWAVPDGRLMFSQWMRRDPLVDPVGQTLLMSINIDGTDYALFGQPAGKKHKRMACYSPSGLILFVEGETLGPYGAGQLGSLSYRRPLKSYRSVTSAEEGLFHSPSPLPDGTFLVAHRPPDRPSFGIWRFDPRTGERQCVFDDPNYDELQPRALLPRSLPDGRSSVVDFTKTTGKLYCLTAKISDLPRAWWPPNEKLRVRLLEAIPYDDPAAAPYFGLGFLKEPNASPTIGPAVGRRFLGEFDLEEDWSFQAEVPANVPIELQLVDQRGVNLRSCRWIWVMPNENRGCIGCHEDGELTPPNDFAQALGKPAVRLTLSPERRRYVDFVRHVWPIIREKCFVCHKPQGAPPQLVDDQQLQAIGEGPAQDQSVAWQVFCKLLEGAPARSGTQAARDVGQVFVYPGHARLSSVIWHMVGTNLARPWDGPVAQLPAIPIPGEHKVQFSQDEILTWAEWIDTGAVFRWAQPVGSAARTVQLEGTK